MRAIALRARVEVENVAVVLPQVVENAGWINGIVYDAVAAHDGSISAEHGIGALKRDELAQRKSPVALKMMRAIKQALDPKGIMNPGKGVV